MNEKIDNGRAGVTQFAESAPIYAGRQRMGHGIRLAIFSAVLVLPLAFFLALKPTSARVVWEQFARMIEFKGTGSVASSAKIPATMSMDLRLFRPKRKPNFFSKKP